MNHRLLMTCAALAFLGALSLAQTPADEGEKLPPGAQVVRLEVTPKSIDLTHRFDYRQVLVTGILQTGERVDLTRLAMPKNAAAHKIVSYSSRGLVRPVGDGGTELQLT